MKKTTLTILLTALSVVTLGQITTTKVAPKVDQVDYAPYDSLKNFLAKDVSKYLGQELYLKGKAESLRKFGYVGFSKDYTQGRLPNQSNVYKCCDSYNSKYDLLAGKYFKVREIIKHPKAAESQFLYGKISYLKLEEKESKDIVYFEYNSEFEHSFPFIVAGYFVKQKKLIVEQEYIFTDKVLEGSTDIETGKEVTIISGQKWKCVDMTIEEKYYNLSLVIQNSLEQKTTKPLEIIYDKRIKEAYSISEADNYKKKFGNENFNIILKGKVKIGMTKEMCILSWGEPKSINETITAGKKTEQWVYSGNYLYFDNGILTAMQ